MDNLKEEKDLTAENVLAKTFMKLSDSQKEQIISAMNRYAEIKWNEGCNKLLKDISNTFLDGVRKADKESDKDVYQVIGETIQDYPIPNYKLSLHTGA